MTEEQASKKWCPFARVLNATLVTDEPSHNRLHNADGDTAEDGAMDAQFLCIADACMAWRWHGDSRSSGFCGLAGVPQ